MLRVSTIPLAQAKIKIQSTVSAECISLGTPAESCNHKWSHCKSDPREWVGGRVGGRKEKEGLDDRWIEGWMDDG